GSGIVAVPPRVRPHSASGAGFRPSVTDLTPAGLRRRPLLRSAGGAGGGLEQGGAVRREELLGVRRRALGVEVDLEVEVRPCGVAVVADLADDVAGLDGLALLDEDPVLVHVDVPAE